MITLRRLPARAVRWRNVVAAIGIFDGVHRGHQVILKRAVQRAKAIGGTPIVVTFYPHPLAVLAPQKLPTLILSLDERLEAFRRQRIHAVVVIPFTRSFSRWSAQKFVEELLVKRLRVKEVIVGHDFGFGRGRSGNVDALKEFGRRSGFRVWVAAPIRQGRERVASRRIRALIQSGQVGKASQFLMRPPSVTGRVVAGSQRGQQLGFPTANLRVESGVLPAVGVYAVTAHIGGRRFTGMANIGFRPTFAKRKRIPLLEVHLFGVRRPLYGQRLQVAFRKRLRPERRFASAAALARQLRRDALRAKRLLDRI